MSPGPIGPWAYGPMGPGTWAHGHVGPGVLCPDLRGPWVLGPWAHGAHGALDFSTWLQHPAFSTRL